MRKIFGITAAAIGFTATPAMTQYPTKPVERVVPYAAGGWINSDIITNAITRPGGKFNVETRDMSTNLVTDPAALSVAGNAGIGSRKDFIAAAKDKTMTVSHEGVGGDAFLAVLHLEQVADIKLSEVVLNLA